MLPAIRRGAVMNVTFWLLLVLQVSALYSQPRSDAPSVFSHFTGESVTVSSTSAHTLLFSDVPSDDPDRSSIEYCVQTGILQASGERFHGDKSLNRYQWCVILLRLVDKLKPPIPISSTLPIDVPEGHWSARAVRVSAPIMNLTSSSRLHGNKTLSIGAACEGLDRLLALSRLRAVSFPGRDAPNKTVTRRLMARYLKLMLEAQPAQ